eukprot:6491087-Amphidinium_carterae.1
MRVLVHSPPQQEYPTTHLKHHLGKEPWPYHTTPSQQSDSGPQRQQRAQRKQGPSLAQLSNGDHPQHHQT